jgi:hypothetical protein
VDRRATDNVGVHTVGHDGGQQGTSTDFLIVPDRGVGVVTTLRTSVSMSVYGEAKTNPVAARLCGFIKIC